jgi:hypothetical protein
LARTDTRLSRSSRRRSDAAFGAVLFGLLSVATVPAAVAYTHYANRELLKAEYAVPVAFLLGIVALSLAKRARRRSERTIGRVGGTRAGRWGRILGGFGVYVAFTAALAVGVYELLNRLSA